MKEQRSAFQTVIFIVFAAFIVIAVLVFAGLSGGGGTSEDIGEVVVWGTFDEGMMEGYLNVLKDEDERIGGVVYQELNPEIYHARLTEAIANGRGPDLFILDQSRIIQHESKIIPISFERVSERAFKDTFIDQGEMFIGANGIIGMPWSIDPLVLYWNRDYFAQSGFSQPPVYWDEIFAMAERMTERDSANTVVRSTIAFGEYSNVEHAKDVIATLMLQAGGQIVARERDGTLLVRVAPNRDTFRSAVSPAQSALRFYTEFADPVKSVYSWNRSLPNSLDAFAQGRLALYVGRASDIDRIQAKTAI